MISKTDAQRIIQDYTTALYRGDKATASGFLGADFGRHAGRDRDDHLAHELWEYATREGHFGLAQGFSIRIEAFTPIDTTRGAGGQSTAEIIFSIVNAQDQLVYRDVLVLDDQGLLVGDQAPFEVIGKLRFEQDRTWRVIVAHQVTAPPARVNPVGAAQEDADLLVVDQPSGMHVVEYRYAVTDDTFNSQHQRFRFYQAGTPPTSLQIYMPGQDHWAFEPNQFPDINTQENAVSIRKTDQFMWHLQVQLADGELHDIELPTELDYRFDKPVTRAILTDALDHDWVTTAKAT